MLLSKIFPVSKGASYRISIAGASARIIRTKGDQIKIDLLATGRDESKGKQVANYRVDRKDG
jgi:hypothetical protein